MKNDKKKKNDSLSKIQSSKLMAVNHLVKLFGIFMASAVGNFFENSISLVQTLHQWNQCLHKSCLNQNLVFHISLVSRSSPVSSLIDYLLEWTLIHWGHNNWAYGFNPLFIPFHFIASETWAGKKKSD